MISLPGVGDPKMDDGTSAFAISLARKDLHLIRVLLASQLQSDIEHRDLSMRVILELDRDQDMIDSELRQGLIDGLKEHYMPSFNLIDASSEEGTRSKAGIPRE